MGFSNSLQVKVGLNSTAFQRGLQTTKGAVSGWAKSVGGMMAATMGVASLIRFGKGVHTFGMQIHDTSNRLKIGTNELQSWSVALSQNGVSSEEGVKALTKLTQVIGEARMNKGLLLDVTKNFGLELDKENGQAKSNTEVLADLANLIQNTTNHTDKVAIATSAFGRAGAKLVPVLDQGSEGLDKYGEMAEKAGLLLDKASIGGMAEADAALERMSIKANVAGGKVLPFLYKAIEKGMDLFNMFAHAVKTIIHPLQFLGSTVIQTVQQKFKEIGVTVDVLVAKFNLAKARITFADGAEIDKLKQHLKRAQDSVDRFARNKLTMGEIFDGVTVDGKNFADDMKDLRKTGRNLTGELMGWNEPIKNAKSSQEGMTDEVLKTLDAEKALAEQAEKYLEKKDDALKALERQRERVEALQAGGEEALANLEARHTITDKTKALMESANLTRDEARHIIVKTIQLEEREQGLIEGIQDAEAKVNIEVGNKKALIEANIEAKKAEKAQIKANRDELNLDLDILNARAQGNDDVADAMELQRDIGNDVKDIADKLGITEKEALGIVEKKLALERQVKEQKNPQVEAEAEITRLANQRITNKLTGEEKAKIRSAKQIVALEKGLKEAERKGLKHLADRLKLRMEKAKKKVIPEEVQVEMKKHKDIADKELGMHKDAIKKLGDNLDAKAKAEQAIIDQKNADDKARQAEIDKQAKEFATKTNEVVNDMHDAVKDMVTKNLGALTDGLSKVEIPEVKNEVKIPYELTKAGQETAGALTNIFNSLKGRFTNE